MEVKKHVNDCCISVREESMKKNGGWLPLALFVNCLTVVGDLNVYDGSRRRATNRWALINGYKFNIVIAGHLTCGVIAEVKTELFHVYPSHG